MRYISMDELRSKSNFIQHNIMCQFYASEEAHYHNFFEMTLVTKGRVYYTINYASGELSAGDLLFLRPNDIHYKTKDSDTHMINLGFETVVLENLLNYLGNDDFTLPMLLEPRMPPVVHLSENDARYFKFKVDKFYDAFISGDTIADTEYRIMLLEIIIRMIPALVPEKERTIPKWLEIALYELTRDNNFVQGVDVLTRFTGKSASSICKAFSRYIGVTPTQYVNKLRLAYACQLLNNSSDDVTTIIYKCGFESISHFNHCFKEAYKQSPTQYRKVQAKLANDYILF